MCGTLKRGMRFIAIIALPMLFSGCTSTPTEADKPVCTKADWYEIGRIDGAQGAQVERLDAHKRNCGKSFNSEWETMYANGRNAGLVDFCDPKNGYELGRSGSTYYYVCPSTVEPQFLTSYRKGQQARELELQNQKLDEQIDQLSQKLAAATSTGEQDELNTALDELKKNRAKNDKALSEIIAK